MRGIPRPPRGALAAIAIGALAALALALLAGARADLPRFPEYEQGRGLFATARDPESCTSCHFAAPAAPAPAPPPVFERREVVVVGGGLAGLTAAWRLRDRDVLLLEKDERAGGKMRRGEWEGIAFSKGAAYLLEPEGDVKALLAELGLAPIRIPEPANSIALGPDRVVLDAWGAGLKDLPYDEATRVRLLEQLRALAARADELAVPARLSSKAMLALDEKTAADYFDALGPGIRRIVDPYVRSCFAAPLEEISALAALAFFSFEFSPVYSFPGGLGALTDALAARLGERVRHGCFATEIEAPKEEAGEVRIAYRNPSGARREVRARTAIVAVSQSVAKYIVKDLAPARRALMDSVYHGAYAVGAVKTARPVFEKSYDTWFLEGPVTDVIVADWVARGGRPRGPGEKQVLSAYMPLMVTGRAELLTLPEEKLRARMMDQLATYFPALEEPGTVLGVDLFVHAHAMHVPYPRYLTEVTAKLEEPIGGKIFFAGVELDLPCLESAVWSGIEAAKRARAALGAPR